MNVQSNSVVAQLHLSFAKPVCQRCLEINILLEKSSLKQLYEIVPPLTESIFGFNNQPGWEINTCRSPYQNFKDLRSFLSPNGVLLRAIYKLCADPHLKYDFPISCLPTATQRQLGDGTFNNFYTRKLQVSGNGRALSIVKLNAFEFYLFHFSYFLVSPFMTNVGIGNSSEALYCVLFDDYMHFLLPLEGPAPPLVQVSQGVKSPIYYNSPQRTYRSPADSPYAQPQQQRSPYMSVSPGTPQFSGMLRKQAASPVRAHTVTAVHDSSEDQTWRSQALIQMLVEQWMCTSGYSVEHLASSQSHESHLPHTDQLRLLRLFIKHLHFFVNSSPATVVASPYNTPATNALACWNDFKRSSVQQFAQKPLYAFLKHNFERWPLDCSFRYMEETWLTYIQPWRYVSATQRTTPGLAAAADTVTVIEERWRRFVQDNVLFYSVLFVSFLRRSLRLDLCTPRNAYMLTRAFKVFALTNLPDYIAFAEQNVEPTFARPSPDANTSGGGGHGYHHLDHTTTSLRGGGGAGGHGNVSCNSSMLVEFQAQPIMFAQDTVDMVRLLLSEMDVAKRTPVENSAKAAHDNSSGFLSFLGLGSPEHSAQQHQTSYTTGDDVTRPADNN